jgi:hypothetical protein
MSVQHLTSLASKYRFHTTCRQVGLKSVFYLFCLGWILPAIAQVVPDKTETHKKNVLLEKSYQQALYAYFQGDVEQALSELSWLEQQDPQGLQHLPNYLHEQDIEPELLKGGLSLHYGLDDQAAEIFERLLARYDSAEKRTQAWFLLGVTYYRQGQWQKANAAFKQITAPEANEYLDVQSHDQWVYLQAQLSTQHLYQSAEASDSQNVDSNKDNWQNALSADSIYHYYLKYNQALSSLQAGNVDLATEQLDELINRPSNGFNQFVSSWLSPLISPPSVSNQEQEQAQQQEIYGVLDRAKLTLGYVLLQQDKPQQAYRIFSQIRREGLDGEAAVLGYGWAAAKSDELQSALGIWQSLIAQAHYSEYSLEAYLASAYAYEKAYAPRQSVAILSAGVNRFDQALSELSVARQQLNQATYLLALAADFEPNQPSLVNPKQRSVDHRALTQIVNNLGVSNEFRHDLAVLQQTQVLERKLSDWQQRMFNYRLMLDEREVQRQQRAQAMLKNQVFAQLPALSSQRDNLAQRLLSAEQAGDGQALMSQQYQQWVTRLQAAQERLQKIQQLKEQLNQQPLKTEYSERLGRIDGVLTWLANEAYPDNHWQAQKALAQLDTEIHKADKQQNQLLTELKGHPDYGLQRQQVALLTLRIEQQLNNNQRLQTQLVSKLRDEVSAVIDQHKLKVNNYIMQAQLAMVRLNDQALQQNQAHGTQLPAADIGRPPQLIPPSGEVQPK